MVILEGIFDSLIEFGFANTIEYIEYNDGTIKAVIHFIKKPLKIPETISICGVLLELESKNINLVTYKVIHDELEDAVVYFDDSIEEYSNF